MVVERAVRRLMALPACLAFLLPACVDPPPPSDSAITAFQVTPSVVARGMAVTIEWSVDESRLDPSAPERCFLVRRAENDEAREPQAVACSGSLVEVPYAPLTSGYVRYQLSVLKHPQDAVDPYWLANATVQLHGPPPGSVPVEAWPDQYESVDSRAIPPGETVVYELAVSNSARAMDLLYVDLSQELLLQVFSSSFEEVLLHSSAKSLFQAGGGAPATLGGEPSRFAPQALQFAPTCLGSCVILEPAEGRYYVAVTNTRQATQDVSLYAFGTSFSDLGEPYNDSPPMSPVLASYASYDAGAIETVGDRDIWSVLEDGTVEFIASSPQLLPLRAGPVNADGFPTAGPFVSGQTFDVFAGDYLMVAAVDDQHAGSPAVSSYYLLFAPR